MWTGRQPTVNPFAFPRGPVGRLVGWLMARTNTDENAEAAEVLDVRPGECVLEVGHGPGRLVTLLARDPRVSVIGIDPSPEMTRMALRHNAELVQSGRLRLWRATAARTGVDDAEVDALISVNTVAMWPDLDAGLTELHRVLRLGGRLVITWHRRPRSLALAEEKLQRIEAALRQRFVTVARDDTAHSVIFRARRADREESAG
ncbi:hypothetical protein GCM10022402_14790 [Salinactinospora qingdaonensis]|uniref:Methyltransferase type 11 domain-containing protein n=1 Tax=Salinactinospora qingdaonensis TaxID=702744 RepID=A0ABP7FDR5_9ACTN